MTAPDAVWRVRGEPLLPPTGNGSLDGLRVAVKDLFAVGGYAIGAGNPTWLAEASPQTADAPAVAALRAAGAAIGGIAQTDEMAFSLSGTNRHYGAPPNPAAPGLVPGGSSSGPAAAVALGDAEVGLGTDTAGSIRVPASCCGLYGLRPTHGAVSLDGVHGLAPSFDTAGWLARDAATLRAVGAVLLPPGEPLADPVPERLLLPTGLLAAVPLTVADALRAAARSTAARWGAEVEEAPLSWIASLPALLAAFRGVQAAEAWRLHGKWIDTHPGALAPDVEGRFRYGSTVPEAGEQHDREVLARWRAEVTAQISDRTWLALPAAGGPGHARTAGDDAKDAWRHATLRCTVLASACGLPSAVLPTAAVPPIGLALVAPPGADRALLAALTWSHRG